MGNQIFCYVVLILVVGIPLALYIHEDNKKMRALRTAHSDYLAALDRLKSQPHNADLKQQALAAGRVYSNWTRNRKGVTVFDEMAVMNDINAATAGATAPPAPAAPMSAATLESRLQTLDSLRAKGVITDEEYTERRRALLNDV